MSPSSGGRVAIHQPNFNPYVGVLAKYLLADRVVHLDTVQFVKNEFQNRNRILREGRPEWLTIPVLHRRGQLIREVRINPNERWRDRHLKTLSQTYAGAPRLDVVMAGLEKVYAVDGESFVEWNLAFLNWLFEELEIATPVHVASKLKPAPQEPNRRLIGLIREVGGVSYLAGAGGRDYMDPQPWKESEIPVEFLEYRHPVYDQGTDEFIPYCGVLDLLVREPPNRVREIALSGAKTSKWES